MLCSTASVTETGADAPTPENEADTTAAPLPTALIVPPLTVATEVSDDDHAAEAVTSCFDPSLNVAYAEHAPVVPMERLAVAGSMESDTAVAGVTPSCAAPEMSWNVAVTVTLPACLPFTTPEATTEATATFDVDQVTAVETSSTVPSEKVAVAVNGCWTPAGWSRWMARP